MNNTSKRCKRLERMSDAIQSADSIRTLATSDLYVLAYAQHMMETARSKAAKNWFETCATLEKQRLKRLVAVGSGTGGLALVHGK